MLGAVSHARVWGAHFNFSGSVPDAEVLFVALVFVEARSERR